MASGRTRLERLNVVLTMLDRMSGPIRGVGRNLQRFSTRVKAAGQAMRTAFIGAVAAMAVAAAALAGPVTAFAKFEAQMGRVQALSGATATEFAQLTGKARELGASTRFSAREAAQGMEFLAIAGFKSNQIIAAMPGLLNVAAAGALDLGRTADITSDILTAFRLEASQMGRVGDVLTKTFTSTNTNLELLGTSLKTLGGLPAKLNVSLEETSALLGLLANEGVKGTRGGTALRAMFLRLSGPVGEAGATLRSLGVETRDAAENLLGITGILEDLDRALRPFGRASQIEKLKQIFGEEPSGALATLLGAAGRGEIRALIGELETAGGTASRIAEIMGQKFAGKVKTLTSAFESLNITIGQKLAPVLVPLVEKITAGIRAVDAWAERFPNLTRLIFLGTAALALFVAGLLVLKIFLLGAALLFSPVILAVLGVIAAVAVLIIWWDKLKVVVVAFGLLALAVFAPWALVLLGIGAAIAGVVIWWDKLKAGAVAAIDFITRKWNAFKSNLALTARVLFGPDTAIGKLLAFAGIETGIKAQAPPPQTRPAPLVATKAVKAIEAVEGGAGGPRVNMNVKVEKMDVGQFQRLLAIPAGA